MKRALIWILTALLICGLLPAIAEAEGDAAWWEQDVWSTEVLLSFGAELPDYDAATNTYEIARPEQLLYMTGVWKTEDTNGDGAPDAPCSGTYVLTQDLDMAPLLETIGAAITEQTGTETKGYMPPIGALADEDESEGVHCAFFGTFDGQGHAIKNLRVVRMGDKYCGLFGNIGHDFGEGYAKDLAILDAEIVGKASCGILCGSLYGDADRIVCTGTIDCQEKTAGGLAGKVKRNENGYYGIARDCFVYCDILVRGKGNENGAAGGVSAANSNGGQIVNCYIGGSIRVRGEEADSVGGVVGNLKSGTAIDNNVVLLSVIDGGEDSQNIGYLCGNYAGDSGSHIHNNYVYEGTRLYGCVASSHPEEAAFTVVSGETLRTRAFYAEQAGWDFEKIWAWVGDEQNGYPIPAVFRNVADPAARIDADLTLSVPVLRPAEPMANSAYAGDPVTIETVLLLPEGAVAGNATLRYGTSKKRASCTEKVTMERTETGYTATITPEIGTYFYYWTVEAGGTTLSFPSEGTLRLDVVSETVRCLPEQLTLTPGATVTEMNFNWITAADGLSAELRWRKAGENSWTVEPVTEIEQVRVLGDHGTFMSYSVDLKGLTPGETYEYMAATNDGAKDYVSSVYSFTALPAGDTFSFVLISDLQSTNEEGYLPYYYTDKAYLTDTLHPDFVVNLGDLTEDDTMSEWEFLFDTLQEVLATTPTAYVPGNHESKGDVIYSHFKGRTNLPDGIDDPMLKEATSVFTAGDVCFVTLNTEPYTGIDGTDAAADKMNYYELQKAWAKEAFEASGCTYRIVLAHAGLVQKDDVATAFLEQMCEELDVDLFFNGHIHNYFRASVNGDGTKGTVGEATTFVTTSPMGMKFDEYGGEIDDLLDFQTGGQKDERQFFTYVEVSADGLKATAYQRTEAGDASITKCGDYTAIDSFTISRAQPEQPAQPAAEQPKADETKPEEQAKEPEPAAKPKNRTPLWIALGCGAGVLIAVVAVLLIRKKKKTA